VDPDFRADSELFDVAALMFLAGFFQLLFAFVSKFGKIRQFANRGVVQRSDFDEVGILVLSDFDRFLDRSDS
jgi:hypothetical protein